MTGIRSIHQPRRLCCAPNGHCFVTGVRLQSSTAALRTLNVPAARPEESSSSPETGQAPTPSPPVKDEASNLPRIFGAMGAVLVVVAAFYSVAFYAGSALLMQFKDQIATVTKKDFVPYSERRAAERQLMIERMESGEADVEEKAQAGAQGIDRDFITLLPLE